MSRNNPLYDVLVQSGFLVHVGAAARLQSLVAALADDDVTHPVDLVGTDSFVDNDWYNVTFSVAELRFLDKVGC